MVQTVRTEISNALGRLFDGGHADVTERPAAPPGGHTGGAGGAGQTGAERAADVQGQVQAAIGQLRADEARQRSEQEQAARIKALEEQIKRQPEKAPRQWRAVERFMGWPDDDD